MTTSADIMAATGIVTEAARDTVAQNTGLSAMPGINFGMRLLLNVKNPAYERR
jgi:hypothetical protein